MCERMERIEKLTETVKQHADKAVEASQRLCTAVSRSNGQIKSALIRKEARNANSRTLGVEGG